MEKQHRETQYDRLRRLIPELKKDTQSHEAFRLIANRLENLESDKAALNKSLGTVNKHYQLVAENYDMAFQYFGESQDKEIKKVFEDFTDWVNNVFRKRRETFNK